MGIADKIQLRAIATRRGDERVLSAGPSAETLWLRTSGGVELVDARLTTLKRVPLACLPDPPPPTWLQRLRLARPSVLGRVLYHAVSPDGGSVVVAHTSGLRMFDSEGGLRWSQTHPPWNRWEGSACLFDLNSRFWYADLTDDDQYFRLRVVDPDQGATLAEGTFPHEAGFVYIVRCPEADAALLAVARGQDGTSVYRASMRGDSIDVVPWGHADCTFDEYGFSRSGHELVTGSHHGDRLCVVGYPSGDMVASITDDVVFRDDPMVAEEIDAVGYRAVFLDNDRILVGTMWGRLLLIERRTMSVAASVWPPGYALSGYAPGSFTPVESGPVEIWEGSLRAFGLGPANTLWVELSSGVLHLLDLSVLMG